MYIYVHVYIYISFPGRSGVVDQYMSKVQCDFWCCQSYHYGDRKYAVTCGPITRNQNILRFNVTMCDALAMYMMKDLWPANKFTVDCSTKIGG